jgi:hypothetical protein
MLAGTEHPKILKPWQNPAPLPILYAHPVQVRKWTSRNGSYAAPSGFMRDGIVCHRISSLRSPRRFSVASNVS